MQIESLRYFIELASAGSFYGAAKSAFISQQGLNKAVSAIEAELDLKLIERSRRGVRLTSDGEAFLRHAKRIVHDYDLMLDDLMIERLGKSGEGDPISLYVSFYGAQTAAADPVYVGMLAKNSAYIEEPFDKLVARAEQSSGNDLIYLDVHANSAKRISANPDVVFEPIVKTRTGFVWKEGSPLAAEGLLHRETIAPMPIAMNTHREMAQSIEWLFRDTPLSNVRMGATSPRMLLEYVQSSGDGAIATFDSFGFFLSQRDRDMPTDGLHFTSLSTPEAISYVGFLYPRNVKLSLRARHTVGVLKRFLAANCAEYYDRYPLND